MEKIISAPRLVCTWTVTVADDLSTAQMPIAWCVRVVGALLIVRWCEWQKDVLIVERVGFKAGYGIMLVVKRMPFFVGDVTRANASLAMSNV